MFKATEMKMCKSRLMMPAVFMVPDVVRTQTQCQLQQSAVASIADAADADLSKLD